MYGDEGLIDNLGWRWMSNLSACLTEWMKFTSWVFPLATVGKKNNIKKCKTEITKNNTKQNIGYRTKVIEQEKHVTKVHSWTIMFRWMRALLVFRCSLNKSKWPSDGRNVLQSVIDGYIDGWMDGRMDSFIEIRDFIALKYTAILKFGLDKIRTKNVTHNIS